MNASQFFVRINLPTITNESKWMKYAGIEAIAAWIASIQSPHKCINAFTIIDCKNLFIHVLGIPIAFDDQKFGIFQKKTTKWTKKRNNNINKLQLSNWESFWPNDFYLAFVVLVLLQCCDANVRYGCIFIDVLCTLSGKSVAVQYLYQKYLISDAQTKQKRFFFE